MNFIDIAKINQISKLLCWKNIIPSNDNIFPASTYRSLKRVPGLSIFTMRDAGQVFLVACIHFGPFIQHPHGYISVRIVDACSIFP